MTRELFPLPAAEVRPADTLADVTKQIRSRRSAIKEGMLTTFRDLGVLYKVAKDKCLRERPVVSWYKYLEKIGDKPRVVTNWVRIADNWSRISAVTADMTLDEALIFLSQEWEDDPHITFDQWSGMSAEERTEALNFQGERKFNDQGDNENIRWALWSWNPVTGCEHNCPYCYARDMATMGRTAVAFPNGFAPSLIPARLKAPRNTPFPEAKAAEWRGHKNVFVCSMADLFGRWVPREWIEAVLAEVCNAPQWNFLFLTKFPIRMAEFDFPDNAWVGTTVDCQSRVANAEKAFRKVKAGVKWLSCEPLIEPLKFKDLSAFQWIVLGGASRSSQTPVWHPPDRWVLDMKEEAIRLGIPFFLKKNLRPEKEEYYPGDVPEAAPEVAPESLRYLPGK